MECISIGTTSSLENLINSENGGILYGNRKNMREGKNDILKNMLINGIYDNFI